MGDVERTGEAVLVGRYGRIVAALVPLPERTVLELHGAGSSEAANEDEPEAQILPEWADLDDAARMVLGRALEAHPMPFGLEGLPPPASKTGAALGSLEMLGLILRDWSGKRLTKEGLVAARWLREGSTTESGSEDHVA